ncbi:MAG: transporter substrate-binding domain-containing protein [Chloroflexota bacterium]|nr:transporter substrate-binding domain-containing protein [Chloroflexota bacterium]
MSRWRYLSVLFVTLLIAAACQQTPGGAAPTGGATPGGGAASPAASPGNPNDLLAKVKQAGVLRVSTDPKYPPQSALTPKGWEGFDIDTANEIAKRLGVTVKFETPDFAQVEKGGWAGRWDISVGSMTITEPRLKVLDFTQPYYYTPAQMAARKSSGITTIEGFSGKTVCVAEATTYYAWLKGTLKLAGGAPPPAAPPQNVNVTTRTTDTDCVADPRSGEGWLTSSTTAAGALKTRQGQQYQLVGDPVFYEPLGVAIDKKGPPHDELLKEIDRIIGEMHADGTLSASSKKWFDGQDLTKAEG